MYNTECVCVRAQECNDGGKGLVVRRPSSHIFVHELVMVFRTDFAIDEVLFLNRKKHIQET